MQLSLDEFNRKYKLSEDLLQKVRMAEGSKYSSSSVAGKPKRLGVEILKRFFTSPAAVISLMVFTIILLMAILIPATSPYPANARISDLAYTTNLPPYTTPYVSVPIGEGTDGYVVQETIKSWENLSGTHPQIYAELVRRGFTQDFLQPEVVGDNIYIRYNAYLFFRLHNLQDSLKAYSASEITTQLADKIWSASEIKPILGTEQTIAYDIWTRTWYATWKAIKISFIVAAIQAIIGVSLGAYLGFRAGSMIDTVTMRAIDIFDSAPTLIWILIFTALFGAHEGTLIITLSLVGWSGFVGGTRMYIITVKNEEYISAARAIGAKTSRQVFVHALPAIIGKIANSFVRSIPGIIMWIASLAFLGFFRTEGSDVNLGQILIDATNSGTSNAWTYILPTLILLFLSLSLSFIALGLHDALDPRVMRKKRN
ncbi:ABC transporter permease [Mycoplasmopsis columbinasalis]|uniref:Dipeptide transport system permease protein dppC n=1 Tax=Mycoplasmopsis columbinasalis TaxID=114880 RepID=A0A449B9T1_9BACT|nr:ABC transporter permease [Mycoplasmopsis columbinasalis]VEU77928.1 Dipeptide transport system permease protein dppC [Mycoplasmopsis columbinasalis]